MLANCGLGVVPALLGVSNPAPAPGEYSALILKTISWPFQELKKVFNSVSAKDWSVSIMAVPLILVILSMSFSPSNPVFMYAQY